MTRRPSSCTGAPRALRGLLLAASSAVLAASAHVSADGVLPNPALTVVLTAIIGWVGTALADRTRGILGLLTTLSAAQLLMHGMLTLADTHSGGGTATFDPTTMTAAHAVATVLTAVLVGYAERGIAVVTSSLRRLLPMAWSPQPAPAPVPAQPVTTAADTGAFAIVLRHICGRRGPPLPS